MKKQISLNGTWDLYYFEDETAATPATLERLCPNKTRAAVPGNFETALADAGVIDAELYRGMKTVENQKFEDYDWWYRTTFQTPALGQGEHLFLRFGAVDCLAEYYVNDQLVYTSDNAFMEQRFEITDAVTPCGVNTLHVHIKSAMRYAYAQEYNQYLCASWNRGHQTHLRKPAHGFGWDIFPRAVSGGIWRDVDLEVADEYALSELSYFVSEADEKRAVVHFFAVIDAPHPAFKQNIEIKLRGVCGEHTFTHTQKVWHGKTVHFTVGINDPCLWWPYGYGEACVYDMDWELLFDGQMRDNGRMNVGLRTVQLVRTETMNEPNHCFKFVVNGLDIMCRGSNWVPLDAYHSRDKAKYQKALELFTDTHCNILRVWGGGVYEQEEFYDYCDRHGIMVWQDFCVACYPAPFEGKTAENIEREATWAVKTLRHHPSIVLWAGDNEVDQMLMLMKKHTGMNKLNREILPKVVDLHDTGRPYLASSPYCADECSRKNSSIDAFPEWHLWGPRDYFKAPYYSQSKAHFVSETGYHGCPCKETVAKTVDADKMWPIYNEQWSLHSSDQCGSMSRVKLMEDQIVQLFGFKPDNLDDFILASQISQAEAKKYFIERIRVNKPYTSGIIWWNMLDGWPQMSDAVVDYFFEKKLAYGFIKCSQRPFALVMDEMSGWNYRLHAVNDTREPVNGTYRVYDPISREVRLSGAFSVAPGGNDIVGSIRMMYSDQAFLVIEWTVEGKTYFNHYLCGYPGFDFKTYCKWLDAYKAILTENGKEN